MEALGRAALFKYEADKVSSVERKVHEMCQLIIASPVGRAAGAQQASQAGNTGADGRRRGVHLVTDENSLHALLSGEEDVLVALRCLEWRAQGDIHRHAHQRACRCVRGCAARSTSHSTIANNLNHLRTEAMHQRALA